MQDATGRVYLIPPQSTATSASPYSPTDAALLNAFVSAGGMVVLWYGAGTKDSKAVLGGIQSGSTNGLSASLTATTYTTMAGTPVAGAGATFGYTSLLTTEPVASMTCKGISSLLSMCKLNLLSQLLLCLIICMSRGQPFHHLVMQPAIRKHI